MWYCACIQSILTSEGVCGLSESMTSLYVVLHLFPIYDLVICGITLVSSLYLHQRVSVDCKHLWPHYMWYCACFWSILTSKGEYELSASLTSLYVALPLFPVYTYIRGWILIVSIYDLFICGIALVSSLWPRYMWFCACFVSILTSEGVCGLSASMTTLYVVLCLFPVYTYIRGWISIVSIYDLVICGIALVSSLYLHQRVNINCQHLWPRYMWYCACIQSILTSEGEYQFSASMTSLYEVLRLFPVFTYIWGWISIFSIYDLFIWGIALVSSLYLHQRVNINCQHLWPRYMWYCTCFQSILTSEGEYQLSASMTSLYVVLHLFSVYILTSEGEYQLSASMTSLYVVLRLYPVYTYIRGGLWIVSIYDLIICGIVLVSSLYLHQRVSVDCQHLWPRYMWYCAWFPGGYHHHPHHQGNHPYSTIVTYWSHICVLFNYHK